jgi:hypothetical protein
MHGRLASLTSLVFLRVITMKKFVRGMVEIRAPITF